jgi:Ca-activated chloride channel homolog
VFAHPWWFLLLLVLAALVGGYLWMNRRRLRRTMRFTNLSLLERIAPRSPGWWRHAPMALVGVALVLLTIALAGPMGTAEVPRNRATVMLTIDVSLSMRATDVVPSRIQVAQRAAAAFADQLPPGINLGLASFAATPSTLVTPTTDRQAVKNAIGSLQLAESTGTGDAIRASLAAIRAFAAQIHGPEGPPPARIILLSDGKQTTPTTDPADDRGAYPAAAQAKQQGVPISAISFGTEYGEIEIDGRPVSVAVADDEMQQIASLSGGEFRRASSELDLRETYANLAQQVGYEEQRVNLADRWFIAATIVLLIGATTAIVQGQRLP